LFQSIFTENHDEYLHAFLHSADLSWVVFYILHFVINIILPFD